MQTIELFSGTQSFSKVMNRFGHDTFTVDHCEALKPDLATDILSLSKKDFPQRPRLLWCSPPCEGFSIASVGHHWNPDRTPKTDTARHGLDLVRHSLRLIEDLQPDWFFIENPRGMLRKQGILDHLIRHTVSYCQYGDERMKPTDIWTNADWWTPKPMCRNGAPCHVPAPRGSKTGTQGLKNATQRGAIPSALFEEILEQFELHQSGLSELTPSNICNRISLNDHTPPLSPDLIAQSPHMFAGVANK